MLGENSRGSEGFIESDIQRNSPECVVQKGDKVSIDRVEIVSVGNAFDHPHDLELREAYLRIEYQNGKIQKLKTPITYQGRTAVLDHVVSNSFVDHISERILRHFGLGSVRDLTRVLDDKSYAYRALRKACQRRHCHER